MQQLDMGNFLSMMMAKMEESSMAISNMTNRFNIIFRILFEKNLITKDDILNSLRKEYNLLKNLESVKDVVMLMKLRRNMKQFFRGSKKKKLSCIQELM